MPDLDGTGPENKGALTGRRRGRCLDKTVKNKEMTEEERGYRRGYGHGRGSGYRSRGHRESSQGFGRRFQRNSKRSN